MTAEEIAKGLGGKRNGAGWRCKCPAHDDTTPSLDIKDGEKAVLASYAVLSPAMLRAVGTDRFAPIPLHAVTR